MEDGQPVGILRRNDLVKALSGEDRDATVAEAMTRGCEMVDESSSLKAAVESMHSNGCTSVPVMGDGHMVGLLTWETVSEMIMISTAMEHQAAAKAG